MNMFIGIFKKWLPLAILTVGACGLVYLAVQQSLRASANDPQIQMAEDAASALNSGTKAETLIPAKKVDLAISLAPFMMVFDETGNVVVSSVTLQGQNPPLPPGVLDYVKQNGEDRVTWQPENGIRVAAVIVKSNNGFVLTGRSLLEIEKRVSQMGRLSFTAVLVIWVLTFTAIALGEFVGHEKAS
jgi:hypothetical protein